MQDIKIKENLTNLTTSLEEIQPYSQFNLDIQDPMPIYFLGSICLVSFILITAVSTYLVKRWQDIQEKLTIMRINKEAECINNQNSKLDVLIDELKEVLTNIKAKN